MYILTVLAKLYFPASSHLQPHSAIVKGANIQLKAKFSSLYFLMAMITIFLVHFVFDMLTYVELLVKDGSPTVFTSWATEHVCKHLFCLVFQRKLFFWTQG